MGIRLTESTVTNPAYNSTGSYTPAILVYAFFVGFQVGALNRDSGVVQRLLIDHVSPTAQSLTATIESGISTMCVFPLILCGHIGSNSLFEQIRRSRGTS
jgi:hypothetical protein